MIGIAILIAIPLLYFWIGFFIGRHVLRIERASFWLIYVGTLAVIPTAWLGSGYLAFRVACDSTNSNDFINPVRDVDGFYLKTYVLEATGMRLGGGISRAPYDLVDDHTYNYVEHGDTPLYYRYDYESKSHRPRRDGVRTSKYDFEITTTEPVSPILKPYYRLNRIRISNAETGEIIAQSTEYVYGGGLLGQYFKYLGSGWSNNHVSLACGYVQKSPHYFRPGDATKDAIPIINGYLARDREFILKALVPADISGDRQEMVAPNTSLEPDAQRQRAAQHIR
jgi:hypothetical protein